MANYRKSKKFKHFFFKIDKILGLEPWFLVSQIGANMTPKKF